MNNKLIKDLKNITKNPPINLNSNRYQDLIDASKEFEKLVEKGLVKKRGYNLLSREECLKSGYIKVNQQLK